jgi:hypothetical protein
MKEIKLTRGQVALVDDCDFEDLNRFSWFAHWEPKTHTFYAYRIISGTRGSVKMHRQILAITDPKVQVDHRNHITLDNQRSNLRVATSTQNHHNTRKRANGSSRFKGVTWDSNKNRWRSKIVVNRKRLYLGDFIEETQAAHAYDEAAKRYFGEFACINFPAEGEIYERA